MPSKKPKINQNVLSRAVSKGRPKATASTPPAKSAVYQLKITLNDIRPPIWRRVQTKDCTLAKLETGMEIIYKTTLLIPRVAERRTPCVAWWLVR